MGRRETAGFPPSSKSVGASGFTKLKGLLHLPPFPHYTTIDGGGALIKEVFLLQGRFCMDGCRHQAERERQVLWEDTPNE